LFSSWPARLETLKALARDECEPEMRWFMQMELIPNWERNHGADLLMLEKAHLAGCVEDVAASHQTSVGFGEPALCGVESHKTLNDLWRRASRHDRSLRQLELIVDTHLKIVRYNKVVDEHLRKLGLVDAETIAIDAALETEIGTLFPPPQDNGESAESPLGPAESALPKTGRRRFEI
jgi:hypothetical protein